LPFSQWVHLPGMARFIVTRTIIFLRVIIIRLNYGCSEYVIKLNEFDHSDFWESRNGNISISSMNRNSASWEWFAIPCCSYSKISIFRFFHIHWLHAFGSTLSDFRWAFRAAWTANHSFSWIGYSD
jgi:hypothetical protein